MRATPRERVMTALWGESFSAIIDAIGGEAMLGAGPN
jgi:hypothetical protein